MPAKTQNPLIYPISTKFRKDTYQRLLKVSKNPKLYFGMSSVPVAEVIRLAVEEKLDILEAQAKAKVRMP